MKNKKQWDILVLSGNVEDVEIISSYILDESLGSHLEDGNWSYYFEEGKKDVIENILNQYISKFDVNYLWELKEQENWHLSWKDNFTPIHIDKELVIIPDWDTNIYNNKNIIKIRPGMAFGTGHHETTFLMLKHLISNIKEGDSVLDLGSGSGILSIAAHIYKASKVTAIEYDEDCKDNFYENMSLNNINEKYTLSIQDVLIYEDYDYDLIIANINKNVLVDLLPNIKHFQKNKCKIILSGLLIDDQEDMMKVISKLNYNIIKQTQMGEWICIVLD